MSFRDNLIHLRAENNMTQERLATLLGVSRQSVTKWEAEKSYPEMDKLIKMCQIFDCTLDDLVQGDLTGRVAPAKQIQIAAESQPADVFGYDEHMSQFAMRIAMGVASPILGIGIAIIFFAMGSIEVGYGFGRSMAILPENIAAALGLMFVFLGIIICLMMIIPAGLAHSDFVKSHPYIEDFYTTDERTRAKQSFTYQLVFGILSIFIGILVVIVVSETPFEEIIGVPLMLVFISIGVFLIVHGSMTLGKTNISNYNTAAGEVMTAAEIESSDLSDTEKARLMSVHKTDKRKGAICGIIMLIATVAGLVMLFVPGYQSPLFWLAWPIGGICCGIVSLLMTAITGEDTSE